MRWNPFAPPAPRILPTMPYDGGFRFCRGSFRTTPEGDGDGWSVHGHVQAPRRFVYWREEPLRVALAGAGWRVERLTHGAGGNGQEWIVTRAVRF